MIPPSPADTLFESLPALVRAETDPPDVDDLEFVQIYEANFGLLVALAVRKFQVPFGDAEGLAHEVFLSYLKRRKEIRELHKWLIGAICNASRYYWRKHGRNIEQLDTEVAAERPDPRSRNVLIDLPDSIALSEVMERMPPRWAHILRLRYFEGYSIKEIAEQQNVTSKYMQKLVAKCLQRAQEIFNGLRARKDK
jgi:RNA polymerase sigma-70 factor (ECF subfamily)